MRAFQTIIRNILNSHSSTHPLCSFDIKTQFEPQHDTIARLNAAFLISLAGKKHSLYDEANKYLQQSDDAFAIFLKRCLPLIKKEITTLSSSSDGYANALKTCEAYCSETGPLEWSERTQKALWQVFFPEGIDCLSKRDEHVAALRKKRTICITQLNGSPMSDPAKELLFTSNILLTTAPSKERLESADLPEDLKAKVREVQTEKQLFWFDHPVQIGVETDKNEVIYGLRGLNATCAFEKQRGNMTSDDRATCVLSVSVTHKGLQNITKEYLEAEFKKVEPLQHLNVYIFTEHETSRLIDEVLVPAAESLIHGNDTTHALKTVFGVDGEYGRHYSFLKAIAALWHVLIDDNVKATFKIDLDQVFPQEELVDNTGRSAFEHYMSPLWGATGEDASGKPVELGMIAGALVNENDISKGLYTPDVPFPEKMNADEGVVFMSGLPMALSTEAEMGTRYTNHGINGINQCIQRVHVTGGTNGILVDSLRKHRPFTPTFIGRAEDQAYLMSVLLSGQDAHLRYFHCDGLIMRHDKYAFAGEAIEAAKVGRQTGDLVRILYFSSYAQCLPWSLDETKDALDPFTGCFLSHTPLTIVMLRLSMSLAMMFAQHDPLATELATVAMQRLGEALDHLNLSRSYGEERAAWNLYYDILDAIDHSGSEMDSIRNTARELVNECLIASP